MRKLTIQNMMELAERRSGKCLSDAYINVRSKLLWECNKFHQWQALPSNIKRGHWCPVCAVGKKRGRPKGSNNKNGKVLEIKVIGAEELKWLQALLNEHHDTLWEGKYTRFDFDTYEEDYNGSLLWGYLEDGTSQWCWDLDNIDLWKEICEKCIGWADFTLSALPGNSWRRFFHKVVDLPKTERIWELRSTLKINLINTINE